MTQQHNDLVTASITVGDVRIQFNGGAESVLASVVSFLSKEVPGLDLARRISLNYSVTELIDTYSSLVKITPEGPRVINDSDAKLSDKEVVALQLVGAKIAKDLGKAASDAMQVSEIHSATALNPKSISSRISEMLKSSHVERDSAETSRYRITTSGIRWLHSTISKKVGTKAWKNTPMADASAGT
jgi:predicted transcriptional regulator